MNAARRTIQLSVITLMIVFALALATTQSHAVTTKSTVNVPVKVNGSEALVTNSYSYNQDEEGVIIPVKVSTSGDIEINLIGVNVQKNISAQLYTDAACQTRVSGNPYHSWYLSGDTTDQGFQKLSAGTYYLKVYSYNYNDTYTNTFKVSMCEWTNTMKTIKPGQTIRNYNDRYNGTDRYYKFRATKTGKITLTHNSAYGYYTTLMTAKKKALSDQMWCSNGEKQVFAVKKGVTYVIKITPNDSGSVYHKLTLKQAAVSEKSGKARKSAVKVKAKKKVNGTILPGSSQADWYKFKVSKKKKVTLILTSNASTYLNVTVYNSKGKKIDTVSMYRKGGFKGELTYGTTYGKANKGTYYVKISRKGNKDSGIYSFKWR